MPQIHHNKYTYSLKVFEDLKSIHINQIRFIHVEITEDTYLTIKLLDELGEDEDAKSCISMLELARIHTINYLKRRQQKEQNKQNNNDIYNY